jgi:hypothetical protein
VTKKRTFVAGVTDVVGGALVEFEQQIMRGRPRTEERHLRRESDTAASSDGGSLSIELPNDSVAGPPPADPALGEPR